MRLQKIDKTLLGAVSAQCEGSCIDCIIKACNFNSLKSYLHYKKIQVLREYSFIDSVCVKINKQQLFAISALTHVEYISSVASASVQMNVSKKILGINDCNLTGKGVTIAFIDTGVSSHMDFLIGEKRIVFFKDFILDKPHFYDDNGHGTFIAGVASGAGIMSGGFYSGIAPKSNIISLKALNALGEASADKILDAMEWVYVNHKEYNIKIVCMSFGSEPLGHNDPIMNGAEALWKEGVVIVAAAGNSGPEYQTIKSPGVSGQIITVGGFDDNRMDKASFNAKYFEMAKFSSRGPAFSRFKPDIVAPSVDIISCGLEKTYTSLSGTSVATPMVAGLCALMLEKDPSLTPAQIKRHLLSNCHPITLDKNCEGFGYPVLNLK